MVGAPDEENEEVHVLQAKEASDDVRRLTFPSVSTSPSMKRASFTVL